MGGLEIFKLKKSNYEKRESILQAEFQNFIYDSDNTFPAFVLFFRNGKRFS